MTHTSYTGFGLIEIIVAVGLFISIVSVGLISIIGSVSTHRLGEEHTKATLYAQEGVEALRSIKKQDWTNMTPGEYGIDSSGGTWQLGPTPTPGGKYHRIVRILSVERDGDGNIVETGGTIDPDIRKIEAEMTWIYTPTRINTITTQAYVTNYTKPVSGTLCGALLTSTETTAGPDLIQENPVALVWSDAQYNSTYFNYSESAPTELEITQDGDYLITFTLPMYRTDSLSNNDRSRIQAEVRVNGTKYNSAISRPSYIRNNSDHNESSDHLHILLEGLTTGQKIQIFLEAIADTNTNIDQFISAQATLYAEYIGPSETIFTAQATQGTDGTDLNSSEQALLWTQSRKDTGFTHDNGSNAEQIHIDETGNYLVFVNIPLQASSQRVNVRGRLRLDGNEIPGGQFKQGYIRDTDGDNDSSIHWSGVVRTTSANQILTITVEQEARNGTVTVGGDQAYIYMQKIPSTGIYMGRGNDLTNGSDWNPSSPGLIRWTTNDEMDTNYYAQSAPETLTFQQDGTYFLTYNDALSLSGSGSRQNPKIEILKNGSPVPGAETKTHYIRKSSNHTESSSTLAFPLQDISSGDTLSVQVSQESSGDSLQADTDALLFVWEKNTCGGSPAPTEEPTPTPTETLTPTPTATPTPTDIPTTPTPTPIIGDWSEPFVASTINLPGGANAWGIWTEGNYLYIGRHWGNPNFYVYNISDPVHPVEEGSLTVPGKQLNLFMPSPSSPYIYASTDGNNTELVIINIANPQNPFIAGTFNAQGGTDAEDVFVKGSYAYLVRDNTTQDFVVIDISNPASPVQVGETNLNGGGFELVIIGNYAYVSSPRRNEELQVVDISNPTNPNITGSLNLTSWGNSWTITGSDNRVFIGRENGDIYIIDITTPTSPSLIERYDGNGSISNITLTDNSNYMFVADLSSQGFKAIDISNEMNPTLYGYSYDFGYLYGVTYNSSLDVAILTGTNNSNEVIIFRPQ